MAIMPTVGADVEFDSETSGDSPEPIEAVDTAPEQAPDETPDREAADASDAGKALAGRKKGLVARELSIQERINAATREYRETERKTAEGRQERETLAREIDELKGQKARLVPDRREAMPPADGRDPEPDEQDFDDFAAYVREQSKWAAREAVRYDRSQQAAEREHFERGRWEEQRAKGHAERYTAYKAANPGFEQEVNREDLLLTAPMVDVIKDSPVGPQLMLHMARTPEDVDRLARMHPVLAYGEMKKLEARYEGAHSGPPDASKPFSKARPPIKPVERADHIADDDAVPDDLSVDEHIRRMNLRDSKKRAQGLRVR
ncbi:MAG: hypothetical protein O3A25_18935 [Acidobacteria bacterium]|nr:hypothetical protein [Acidobacteriota bacterium]